MTQLFTIDGMMCGACEATVKKQLTALVGVREVTVDRKKKVATLTADAPIGLSDVAEALKPYPRYKPALLTEKPVSVHVANSEPPSAISWVDTYRPILLIAAYITVVAFLTAFHWNRYSWAHFRSQMFLHSFMTGFLLVFSFFKLLDVKAFARSFKMYDPLAKYLPGYAESYPFTELVLGIMCLLNYQLNWVYVTEIFIMGVGLIGVANSIVNKRAIQCACLGTVFKLPMSRVTLIENTLMIAIATTLLILTN